MFVSLASLLVFADGVTIKFGDNVWSFGLNFILYLVIAAVVGLIAEAITGWRVPFGFVGAIIAAIIGIWLMTQVISIQGIGDIYLFTVPIFRALIGAIIFVLIWHLISLAFTRRPRRSYRAG